MGTRLRIEDGVAWVTLDHPPTNLFDLALMVELDQVSRDLEADDAVRVVVVDSADPDIWIAHADVELILRIPDNPPDGDELGFFHAMVDRFRTMPKATIALVEGIARGGGCELASSMDMRFGTIGTTVVGQPESLVGILPGGSGTQRWPRLVGRGRAMEVVLGGADLDAETAERWGWLNRAFPPGEARPHVEALAARIASVPAEVIALSKRCVDAALGPVEPGLLLEAQLFHVLAMSDEGRRRMQAFLDGGGQAREAELGGRNFSSAT
jgi:enoyl-CoA hydratase/carnithine racemase